MIKICGLQEHMNKSELNGRMACSSPMKALQELFMEIEGMSR